MGAFVRWVLLPIAIVALGLAWQFYEYADAVQETCGPDCISSGDLAAWRAAFLIALALWIGLLVAHFVRRRREDEIR